MKIDRINDVYMFFYRQDGLFLPLNRKYAPLGVDRKTPMDDWRDWETEPGALKLDKVLVVKHAWNVVDRECFMYDDSKPSRLGYWRSLHAMGLI